MPKGKIYLDVDGPLNPYGGTNKPRLRAGYRKYRISPDSWDDSRPLPVWLRREHGAELLALAEAIDFELVWATTWEHEANVWIAGKIGLPKLPVVQFKGSITWKFTDVLKDAGDLPLIWFDDDFALFPGELADFITERGDRPTLLHTVSPRFGLTDEDFTIARNWATAL